MKPTAKEVDEAILVLALYINTTSPGTVKSTLTAAIEDAPGGVSAMLVLAAFVQATWE